MIEVDGSVGEGGGQILRTSLSLSLLLGRSFRIRGIRAGRKRPGLLAQHLTCVRAAEGISEARTEGALLGSTELLFQPVRVTPGEYLIDVETVAPSAGSTGLILQCLFLPLIFGGEASRLRLRGGTHTAWSPSTDYLSSVFAPMLSRMGAFLKVETERFGFYPAGGGQVKIRVRPADRLQPIRVLKRGILLSVTGLSVAGNLPVSIAERQKDRVLRRLSKHGISASITARSVPARCPGTSLVLIGTFENCEAGFSSLGARGKPAERVADEATDGFLSYLASGAVLDPNLADQIILPMALGSGLSEVTAPVLTSHARTNIAIVERFLPVSFQVQEESGKPCRFAVEGIGYSKKVSCPPARGTS